MKKILFQFTSLFVLIFCFEIVLLSQNTKEQNIQYCIDLTINEEILNSGMNQQMSGMMEMPQELIQLLLNLIIEEIDLEELKYKLIPVYDEFYTEDEIASLVAFYKSETGAKYALTQYQLDLRINQFLFDYTWEELPEIVKTGQQAFATAAKIDTLLMVAEAYLYNEKYESSLETLERIEQEYLPDFEHSYILTNNQSLTIRVNRSKYEINSRLGNAREAIENINIIITHYPACDYCYQDLAILKMRIKDYQGALDAITIAIELDDSPSANLYSDRALAKDYLGDHDGADADYDSTLMLTREYYYNDRMVDIGWNKYLVGQYEKCIEYSDKVLEADPDQLTAGYNKALSHLRLGNSDSAFEMFKKYKEMGDGFYFQPEEINTDAITNLKDLISMNIKSEEVKKILIEVFNLTESDINE